MKSEITLGTAPDSWGVWFRAEQRQPPWSRFLDEASEAGYRWIELGPYGYLPTNEGKLSAELEVRELSLAAGGVGWALEEESAWPDARHELEKVCALLRAFGAPFVVIIDESYIDMLSGRSVAEATLDRRQRAALVESVKRAIDFVAQRGLRAVLHPHADSHVATEDEIEHVLEAVPELELCFDVGHHAYCGGDPVAFLREHSARVAHLHLKNVRADHDPRNQRSFSQAVAEGVFVEPAEGAVDFEKLATVLAENGYQGFGIVEQDMFPVAWDAPLPIALRTRRQLLDLGLGAERMDPPQARS